MEDIDGKKEEMSQRMNIRLPLIEKYRPNSLDEVISHDDIVNTLNRFIEQQKLPHLLFYGPPGTGKTSCVLALAKRIYGPKYREMILELNASDERGIDVVREQIKEFCSTQQLMTKNIKMVILDECDSMTNAAQFALRRIIEKFTKNTRFFLTCNYINRIIPAIISRCTRFRFAQLKKDVIAQRLKEIAHSENVQMENLAAENIVDLSLGDMRRVLNIFEACVLSTYGEKITISKVFQCSGKPDPQCISQIYTSLFNDTFKDCHSKIVEEIREKGLALEDIITQIHLKLLRTDLPKLMKMKLIEDLSWLEYRLSVGAQEMIQLPSLVAAFNQARTIKTST